MNIPVLLEINWVDILILVCLARGIYLGFSKGSAWGLVRITGILAITLIAFSKSYRLAQWTQEKFDINSPFLEWGFFILLGVMLGSLVKFIISMVTRMLGVGPEGKMGRVAGMILGAAQASILASLLMVALVMSTASYFEQSVRERSFLGPRFLLVAPSLFTGFKDWIPGGGQPSREVWEHITEG